jgi:hypothetical protein
MKKKITRIEKMNHGKFRLANLLMAAFLMTCLSLAQGQTGTIILKKTTLPATEDVDFFFTTRATLLVNSPAAIAGGYVAGEALFGPALDLAGISGDLERVSDGAGGTDGCGAISGFTAGKIALIDRGNCFFSDKVYNAEMAGAIAVVIVNNFPGGGVVNMSPGDIVDVNIPSLFITYEAGEAIKTQLDDGINVNVTLRGNLADNIVLQHDEMITFEDVPAGTYSFTEGNPLFASFVIEEINISDPDGESNSNLLFLEATIDLDAGETVICEFVNYSPAYNLLSMINQLYDDGILNGGQMNALAVKVESAIENIDKPKFKVATNHLNSLINQVTDLMAEGILTSAQGAMLIDEAVAMIDILDLYPFFKTGIADTETPGGDAGLSQNYPNPFSGSTTVSFTLEKRDRATLKVYNSMGKEIASLFDGVAEANVSYTVDFDGVDLPEGVYFYKLQSGNEISIMKKMILIR